MKFSKLSQLFLVSSIGLLVATVFTACAITTIDYVFVACSAGSGTSNDGQIQTYAVDSQSGALRTGAPAVSSGGVNPVSMAVTSDYANLYVANAGSSTIVHFAIGLNGVLTSKDTATLSTTPISLAVNTAGTYLYVISGPPDSGATLTEYALSSGTIGSVASQQPLNLANVSSTYASDALVPTGITVLANNSTVSGNAVFVSAYDQSAYNPGGTPLTSTANPGWVFGFTIGSGGALTAATHSPYEAGVKPTAIASDPTDRFVYVTDYASNELIGYTILDGSTLSFLPNGPFRTGNEPSAVAIDPRGLFIYVANFAGFHGLALCHRSGHRHAHGRCEPCWRLRHQQCHRHRAGRCHDRPGAGPVCLYRKLPGQLRLRLPPGPDFGRDICHPGYAVPHRVKTHGCNRRSPRQLFHTIGYPVAVINSADK